MLVVKKDGGKEEDEGGVLKKGMQGRKKGMGGGRMKGCRTQGDTNIEEGDEKRHWVVVKGGRTVYFFDILQSPCYLLKMAQSVLFIDPRT